MSQDVGKKAAGKKAAQFIENHMIVGLGTGSTASYFIEELANRVHQGLKIQAVSSSRTSSEFAKKRGIPLLDINEAPHIDMTIDGADEIDPQKRMIKGGGGALLREKILASSSRETVVIIDETKLVAALGKAKLPVEILYFGSPATRKKIEALGYFGKWRMNSDQTLFLTENGNLLFDIEFPSLLTHPERDHQKISEIPGVIDTGFFFNLATRVVIGHSDGKTEMAFT